MKTIKITSILDVMPENYTGIVEFSSGNKCWYLKGLRHREDGPAIIRADGFTDSCDYWFKGRILSKNKIEELINLGYPIKTAIKLNIL